MATHTEGTYGPGTYTDVNFLPVPEDCERLLKYFASVTPGFSRDSSLLKKVSFRGGDLPIIPGPIKAQAVTAVCHAMIGIVASEICALRGTETGTILIDTDQAGMFPATPALVTIDGRGFAELARGGIAASVGADLDREVLNKSPMRYRSWAIYPTKDQHVYFQILGSLDPVGMLQAFGLSPDAAASKIEAYELIKAEITKYSAPELEQKCMEHGFCGQTCLSPQHWRETRMGKDLAKHPMINYRRVPNLPDLPAVAFAPSLDQRPLVGIKIVELSRVIAAPAMGMMLAALGAEVIRIQPPHLHDLQSLNLTLTAGKHTCGMNLNHPEDRERLNNLIADADVFIQAFRLRSLERRGFGLEQVLEIANKRGKGVVYVDLNCYGPDGYYAERPGFQQIADAASGCSYICGKAYGFEEGTGVLPSLPIADMVSGAVGVIDVLMALRDRANQGGSYHASVALTSIDTAQLEREVGLYPPEVVKRIQDAYGFGKMTPDLMVGELLGVVADAWANSTSLLQQDTYFTTFKESPFGKNHKILSPITRFENEAANPYWKSPPVPYCWEKDPQFG